MNRQEIDQRALETVKEIKLRESELIEILQKVERYKIYKDFALTSLFVYCTKRLKLSEDVAYTYIRVTRTTMEIPALKEAIDKVEINLSNAKKVSSVITPENQLEWLDKAKQCTTRELDYEIAKIKPEAVVKERVKPIAENAFELRCLLSFKGQKLLVRALDILSTKKKKALKPGEALESMLEEFIERHDPVKKAERAIARQTSQAPVTKPVREKGKRTAIPSLAKHLVTEATSDQCTVVDSQGLRCQNRRWLHRHHKIPVAQGGQHTVKNLTLLCSSHHRQVHETLSSPN
jgi:hypothetical protein